MHTVLGANGVIAQELSKALVSSSTRIRQVSRNPRRVNQTDETMVCDLLDAQATANAVASTPRTATSNTLGTVSGKHSAIGGGGM